MMNFDSFQKYGKDGMDAVMKSVGAVTKGAQSAALETADFAKRAMEFNSATAEKLIGVRTFDRALEIQGEYVRTSYESLVAQSSKIGEIMTATAKDAYAPIESLVAKPVAA